ncbi:Sugar-specific transcriptional regulator TrmB (plasmid) [Halapricum desulfuricans]|uniref:Sugar-specific transcriptional regulator TrmB n=1 Tax=Halapricum desulfuricans TaxID=2841257 RepID=A0A897NRR7_9EURY|nr:Sugar-specific transcriptional regulator TrmB [Halapricum desulfuricans]
MSHRGTTSPPPVTSPITIPCTDSVIRSATRSWKFRDTALKKLQTALSEAENEAVITVPQQVLPDIEPHLRDAIKRDVLVFLLVSEMDEDDVGPGRFRDIADAVRFWSEDVPFSYAVDDELAMIGEPDILIGSYSEDGAVTVSEYHLTGAVLGLYLSAYWPTATEIHVSDPDPLPKKYDWFRQAVFHASIHHQRGVLLQADIGTTDGTHISGMVSQIRQAFLEPATNEYTLEMSLVIETDEGEVSVGGPSAFIEDYEADIVALRRQSD